MSTTEILFNSPALHSLKRTQLVQLCKRHGVKAAGKNIELVARLREHAKALPTDSPLNLAIRSEPQGFDYQAPLRDPDADDSEGEEGEGDEERERHQRPSEMWEVVMEDIPEDLEEGAGSLPGSLSSKSLLTVNGNSTNEFGTGGSSKSTVSSSIKALATSLGLKRATSNSSIPTSSSNDTVKSLKNSFSSRKLPSSSQPRDSLTAHAVPYASIPPARPSTLPHVEPFAFSYTGQADTSLSSDIDRPVPGVGGRDGVSVPDMSFAGNGTIRLVTAPQVPPDAAAMVSPPKLRPFRPAFELVPPTPGGNALMKWPMSPGGAATERNLYPTLNVEGALENEGGADEMDVEMPGGLYSGQGNNKSALSPPRGAEPFVFGSPHPRHSASKADFSRAAAGVLAEMNARLGRESGCGIGVELLAGRTGGNKLSEEEVLNYQFGGAKKNNGEEAAGEGSLKWRFDRAHEKEFSRMDGIDRHYAARRVQSKTSLFESIEKEKESLAPLPANRKRKSATVEPTAGLGKGRPSVGAGRAKRRSSTARVISAGARKKMGMGMGGIPGGFGDDDDDDGEEEAEEGRDAKRACVAPSESDTVASQTTKRVSIAPPSTNHNTEEGTGEEDEDEKIRKQNEAIRRRLEYNKARRRSSRGRPSIGPRASLVAQKQKGATSRFGFLSSAKSLVRSVWNRGAGNPTPAATASSAIPVPQAKAPTKPAPPPAAAAEKKVLAKQAPAMTGSGSTSSKPPVPNAKKPAFGSSARPSMATRPPASRNVSASSGGFLRPDQSNANARMIGSVNSVTSAVSAASNATTSSRPRSRSPIPSFNPPASGSVRSTRSSAVSNAQAPVVGSTRTRNSSVRGSVAGTNTGTVLSGSRVSSMGTRGVTASVTGVGSMGTQTRGARPSSTLYAPTASSLAKTNANTGSHVRRPSQAINASNTSDTHNEIRKPDVRVVSPSKIPVILPLSPRKKNPNLTGEASGIFSSPLILPTSPAGKRTQAEGHTVNPITGAVCASPTRLPLASASQNLTAAASVLATGAPGGEGTLKRVVSAQRRPRVSRSKVIAKLGEQRQRAASGASTAASGNTLGNTANANAVVPGPVRTDGSRKGRPRSSIGTALGRRSVGGVKGVAARSSGVIMSAKRRARASEYTRRRSAKVTGLDLGDGGMEIDD